MPRAKRYEGAPCARCGGTERYATGDRCCACVAAKERRRWAARTALLDIPIAPSPRFSRPAWFDEPDPEILAAARPGLAAGGKAGRRHTGFGGTTP